MPTHEKYIKRAIELAKQAETQGEVPVGAVVVLNDEIIGEGFNRPIQLHDPSAHAEIVALRNAGKKIGNYRLNNATLYVTLEPCMMCVGAIIHARITQLVFGAYDKKAGAVSSVFKLINHPLLTHFMQCDAGVCERECTKLMTDFFKDRR